MEKSIILKHVTGIQHLGIPTNDIEKTISFYESLGFDLKYRVYNEAGNEEVAFLQLKNLVVETYENKQAVMQAGAIDHIALDVENIEELFESVRAAGYKLLTDEIQSLPFWEHGINYFIIEGPNTEKIEFCEICK